MEAASENILCAVQDAELHEELGAALERWRVTIVRSAYEALRLVNAAAVFDAYVVSYWLPDLAGVNLCKEIRKTDPHVPITVIALRDLPGNEARVVRAGANAYVPMALGTAERLREELQLQMRNAQLVSMQARFEETKAIQDEIQRRAAFAADLAQHGRELAARATERSAKARALAAFLKAGGTIAEFERWWPDTFAWAVERAQPSS